MTTAPRSKISDRTKLASAMAILLDIPFDHQKQMHEDHVLSLVEWDHHPIRKADGGLDVFWNLQPLLLGRHKEKTRKLDIPEIAKGKRIRKKAAAHEARRALFPGPAGVYQAEIKRERPKQKIAQRANPWPKGRKLQSQNRLRRRT